MVNKYIYYVNNFYTKIVFAYCVNNFYGCFKFDDY